ncbi:MAG: CPBP family intramembrane glutamic endopeptidase [Nocardioides sp.]
MNTPGEVRRAEDPREPTMGPTGRAPLSLTRTLLLLEVLLVLAVSLGRSAIYSVVSLIESLTAPGGLRDQAAVMNPSLAPDRPWLDLTLQLLASSFRVMPALLVIYLLYRTGDNVRAIMIGQDRKRREAVRGVVLAAAVGSVGIAFYVASREVGINLTVVAADLPEVWWRYPILVASALSNAVLEEVLVLGYLLTRLDQLGLSRRSGILLSALLRGSYHLYQGIGGFLGNAAMGLLFGWLYTRWGRVLPFVIAHTLLDVGAFIGYAVLADRVGFL